MEFHYLTVGIHHSLYILTYASAKDNLYIKGFIYVSQYAYHLQSIHLLHLVVI